MAVRGPSEQNSIFRMRAGGRDDGISTLHSHQYNLADEGVTYLFSRALRGGKCTKFEENQTNLKRVILPAASSASSSLSVSVTQVSDSDDSSRSLLSCLSVSPAQGFGSAIWWTSLHPTGGARSPSRRVFPLSLEGNTR